MNRRQSFKANSRFIKLLWLLVAVMSLLAAAVSIYASELAGQIELSGLEADADSLIGIPLAVLTYGGIGALILSRFGRHVVGSIFLAISCVFMVMHTGVVSAALVQLGRLDPGNIFVKLVEWLGLWVWILLLILPTVFLPLNFPTGRLPSRRWRIVAAMGAIALVGTVLSLALPPNYEEFGEMVTNPFVFPAGEAIADVSRAVGFPSLFVAFIGSLASMVARYRGAGVTERQQMKWLYLPLAGALLLLIYGFATPAESSGAQSSRQDDDIFFLLFVASIPVAIAIAILRYRLFDIDVIIRKTLVYGVVTAALAAIYFGSVVVLTQLTAGISGERSPVVIVLSTLLIAALFSPLRRRAQEFIDRRFYRAKYDKAKTLAGFARAARDETDLETLSAELLSVVHSTMQPESISLWLKEKA